MRARERSRTQGHTESEKQSAGGREKRDGESKGVREERETDRQTEMQRAKE